MNVKVVNSLMTCFIKSATLMRIIAYTQDEGYPAGRTWKIKERLFKKFAPDNSVTSMKLEEKLNKLTLGSGKNAIYDLFEKTESFQRRFPLHYTDEKLETYVSLKLKILISILY